MEVNKVADYESDEIKLHLTLIESKIAYDWWQWGEVNGVERSMAPDAAGSDLGFFISLHQSFGLQVGTMEENWDHCRNDIGDLV